MAFNKIKTIINKIRKECTAKICSQSIITNAFLFILQCN